MKTPQTRLLLAAIAISFPALVLAQAVVPPPQAPGVVLAPAAQTQPKVAPPAQVTSANPAAAIQAPPTPPAQNLIDIALPDAPKPTVVDLKPAAPTVATQGSAKKPAVKRETASAEKAPVKTAPMDPFSGLKLTPVSDSQLNRFVFPEAVEGIFFPEGAPLPECPEKAGPMDPCKPVFLNGKKVMLLQLRAGAKGPIQMLVHLASGRFETLNLGPTAGPGSLVRIDGAEDGPSDSRLAAGSKANADGSGAANGTSSEKYVAMLAGFANGDIPAGFEPVVVGKPVRFEHFDAIPQATWDNGVNLRAHLFTVQAHGATPVVINASLFRNANVRALALDRETITNTAPAQLYMLEFVPMENQ